MKRLPAQFGITYFSVLAAAFYLSEKYIWILGGIAVVITILFFLIRKLRKTVYLPVMALAALLACAVHLGYTFLAVQPAVNRYAEGEHKVEAVLEYESYQSYSKYYYRLRAVSIDGEEADCRILLKTVEHMNAQVDDILTFRSELLEMNNDYFRAKGYVLLADNYRLSAAIQPARSHSLYYRAVEVREYIRRALDSFLPEDCASLCKAVLIGDKYSLDLSVRENFRYAGASYFIVVSGMHFTVLCSMIMFLLNRFTLFRRNRWIRLVMMLIFVFTYSAVTGFQPSVLRAGVMITFTVIGATLRRKTYPLNHLGFAGIILPLILSPYAAGDFGLILSFYATMSILLWATPIAKKLCYVNEYGYIPRFEPMRFVMYKCRFLVAKITRDEFYEEEFRTPYTFKLFCYKLRNTVCSLFSVTLAANILVFPITVFLFHEFSFWTLLSSLLLYLPVFLILILSFFAGIFFYLPLGYLVMGLSYLLIKLCRFVLFVVELLSGMSDLYIRVGDTYFFIWVVVSLLLGILVILYRNGYRYLKLAALCSVTALLAGMLSHTILESQMSGLEIYACGDGLCAAINHGGNLHLLRLDAKSQYLYDIIDDLTYRYGGAKTALCCKNIELKKYQLYCEDEFAISEYLLYDNKEDDDDEEYEEESVFTENMIEFFGDSVFAPDDELTLTVSTLNNTAIPYYTAYGKNILIIPDGCTLDDIPESMRQADVIILSHAFVGVEQLRCKDLIISDSGDSALMTASVMRECYQNVYITDGENITYRLR